MTAVRELLGILLDALLPWRCLLCGERVKAKARGWHRWVEHGDEVGV